jgi:hypothetical protein
MPIAVDVEIAKARVDLVDGNAVTWSDDDLLECLNEAIRATCQQRPDAYVITGSLSLVAGTIQSLPTGATALFDLIENVAAPGKSITLVDQSLLDESYRYWPGSTQAAEVDHYCADPRDKLQFRVYPPNDGNGEVIGTYGATPETLTHSDLLPLGDQYEPALYAYMLGAAYRKDTQRKDLTKTGAYMQQWGRLLGGGAQADRAVAPKVNVSEGVG